MPLGPIAGAGRRTSVWFALFQSQPGPARSLRGRICAAVREAVQSGRVRHGERLPAARTMAADLKVSRITVEAAYAQLVAEGYVRRRVGDGTFVDIDVAPRPAVHTPSRTRSHGREPWSTRGSRIVGRGGCVDPTTVKPFSAGLPDLGEFPVEIWRRLTARELRADAGAVLGYGDPAGEPALRSAIASYLAQSRGVRCTPDQVLVLTSSQQALYLIATILTDPGDHVWIEDPGYRGAQTALAAMGAHLVPMRLDGEGAVPPESGAAPPRLLYVTPSHQYPTGVTLSLPRRLALLEIARRHGAWLIEDDYDSEFQYDARPLPAMQGLDAHGRVIYIGTFTKVLFPALRLAYVVLPRTLVSGFITARTTHDGHSARVSQRVTAAFMSEGHFAAHLRRMRRLYQQRRDILLDELGRRLAAWCRPFGTAAGLQLTVRLPRGRERELTRAAARAGVETPGLRGLYLSRPPLDGWILGFSALSEDAIVAGVRRLATLTF